MPLMTLRSSQRRQRLWLVVGLAVALCYFFFPDLIPLPSFTSRSASSGHRMWPGWENVDSLFVFGDSYSQGWFNITGTQPNEENPMGNEDVKMSRMYNYYYSRPNWVHFITATHNASFLKTYDFAMGGAVVDRDLSDLSISNPSMRSQVFGRFKPFYTSKTPLAKWDASKALFSMFCGINDLGVYLNVPELMSLEGIMWSYKEQLEELYSLGARNFLVLNVPPIDKSPALNGLIMTDTHPHLTQMVSTYNKYFKAMFKQFVMQHGDVTSFFFDLHGIFSKILGNPAMFLETAAVKNTTKYCFWYESGTNDLDTFHPECGVPVGQYFWLSIQHVTYPVFNATARAIVDDCFGPRGKKGFCS